MFLILQQHFHQLILAGEVAQHRLSDVRKLYPPKRGGLHWHSSLIDAGLEINVYNSCYRRGRTISFHLKPRNSTHSNATILHWHTVSVDTGLGTAAHNRFCMLKCPAH